MSLQNWSTDILSWYRNGTSVYNGLIFTSNRYSFTRKDHSFENRKTLTICRDLLIACTLTLSNVSRYGVFSGPETNSVFGPFSRSDYDTINCIFDFYTLFWFLLSLSKFCCRTFFRNFSEKHLWWESYLVKLHSATLSKLAITEKRLELQNIENPCIIY